MCGIVGVIDHGNQAVAKVVAGLIALEYRGYDSWGIAAKQQNKKVWITKQLGSINRRPKAAINRKSYIALGHTRWATHGGITLENTHPHCDPACRYAVVHNGVIENWQALKKTLPHTTIFKSETDTEIITHLLSALPSSMPLATKISLVGSKLTGCNAFAVLDSLNDQLAAISLGSPLLIAKGDTSICLASDISAFNQAVSHYRPLEPGEIAVTAGYQWETKTGNQIIWSKLGHPSLNTICHQPGQMMLTELTQAPAVIKQTWNLDYSHIYSTLQTANRIWLTGAGSAYHAALFGAHWLRQQHLNAFAFPSTESESFAPIIQPDDLLIAISQSGETRDTLLAVEHIKPKVGKTLGIINRPHSSLDRIVDLTLMTPAGTEYAVLATKSLIAQLIVLYQIASASSPETSAQISGQIHSLINNRNPNIYQQIADLLAKTDWLAVIGEASGWFTAHEVALKFKEGAYLPAEGLAGGELKHGSLALISQDSLCLALDVDSAFRRKLHNHLAEIQARGARIIGLSPVNNPLFDHWIFIPNLGSLTPIGGLIAGQILTYETAVIKGINPDRPRNLAKSVTVI